MMNCACGDTMASLRENESHSNIFLRIVGFQPPKDSLYTINSLETFNDRRMFYQKGKFIHETYPNITYKWLDVHGYMIRKKNKARNKLALIYLKQKRSSEQKTFTLLFSHGHASTLGHIYPFLFDLCVNFKCDIISYDYSGYGMSQGNTYEEEVFSDIEDVASFMNQILSIPNNRIILMGYSLGTAPTVHLAVKKTHKDVLGVILLSPIATAISSRVNENNNKDTINCAVFCNRRKVSDIKCPVFLIHGHKDQTIPIEHSLELAKYIRSLYTWYPKLADHKNIITKYRLKFLEKSKYFIDYIIKSNLNKNTQRDIRTDYIGQDINAQYRKEKIQREENYTESLLSMNEISQDISIHNKHEATPQDHDLKSFVSIKNFDYYELEECQIDYTMNEDSSIITKI